jgi:hypothetical protein
MLRAHAEKSSPLDFAVRWNLARSASVILMRMSLPRRSDCFFLGRPDFMFVTVPTKILRVKGRFVLTIGYL